MKTYRRFYDIKGSEMWKKLAVAGVLGLTAFTMTALAADKTEGAASHSVKAVSSENLVSEERQPTPSLYGIGSVSKVYTAGAIMKLAQDGLVNLDGPLTEYLPDFYMEDARYRDITLRMLLNHTSGLQGSVYTNSVTLGKANSENHDLLLERLRSQRLKADPGSFSVYCNDGFTLAELVVESVTGDSFTNYLKKTFAEPLGLRELESFESLKDPGRLVPIYLKGSSEIPYETANLLGSGGLYSTAEDVCRFMNLFTKKAMDQEDQILTRESVEEMAKEAYQSDIWKEVPPAGSSVAYGLGWDTVKAYPFAGMGIQALSKGGDTTAYHTAVTVLPEKNITCAVTASGGNSMAAGQAVQEILLHYLVRKGELEEEEIRTGTGILGPLLPEKAEGYYASGRQLMKVEISEEGSLSIRSIGSSRDTTQTYIPLSDGSFQSEHQDYISMSGKLVAAEGGIYGRTVLTFEEDQAGLPFLTMKTEENQPRFGTSFVSVPFAQKLEEGEGDPLLQAQWEAVAGGTYILVSEGYNSAMWLENPSISLSLPEEIPGYLVVKGGNADAVLKIGENGKAVFFQQIPGHSGRDLYDLTVIEKNGKRYLDTESFRFVEESGLPSSLELTETFVMAREEEAKVYRVGKEDQGKKVQIQVSGEGHFYLYRPYRDVLSCIASSMMGDGGRTVYLPKDGILVFAGEEGAEFSVERQ